MIEFECISDVALLMRCCSNSSDSTWIKNRSIYIRCNDSKLFDYQNKMVVVGRALDCLAKWFLLFYFVSKCWCLAWINCRANWVAVWLPAFRVNKHKCIFCFGRCMTFFWIIHKHIKQINALSNVYRWQFSSYSGCHCVCYDYSLYDQFDISHSQSIYT